jgi:hypothetical protein
MARFNHVSARGTIIGAVGGPVYLADLVLQSYPPQVGSGIEVRGVRRDHLDGEQLHTSGNAFWCEEITVSGTIEDGLLVAERAYVGGTVVDLG